MSREDREAYLVVRERFERGDAPAARAPLEELARRYPRYADLHYMIGILREREQDLDGAGSSLEPALELNPSYADAALALIAVYEQRGEHERARALSAHLLPAVGSEGLDSTTRGKLANLHAALGDAYRQGGGVREGHQGPRPAPRRGP